MKLHEIIEVHDKPYFRKMRVESGFMYNFWDVEKDDYQQEWTFVPYSSELVKNFEHRIDTTVGLWATDGPDLITTKNTREESIKWWDSLGSNPLLGLIEKGELTTKYFGPDRIPELLTGREIEKMYVSENEDDVYV